MGEFQIDQPEAVALFRKRNVKFLNGSDVLEELIERVLDRPLSTAEDADAVIFFLGNRCAEDFREIALLAAHGHGWGATAHLRGMYERAVAAAHLHENTDDVDSFVEFDLVRRWRAAEVIKRTLNIDAEDEQKLAVLEKEYLSVRDKFRVTDCAKCGTTRINHTWHKLHLVAMAGKVKTLGKAVVPAYYMPLAQAHATFASAAYRLSQGEDGSFFVDPETSANEADRSFQYAHLLMLGVLTVQHEHFSLAELDELLGKAWQHYRTAWNLPLADGSSAAAADST